MSEGNGAKKYLELTGKSMKKQNQISELPPSIMKLSRFLINKLGMRNIPITQRLCWVRLKLSDRIIEKYFLFISQLLNRKKSSQWIYQWVDFEFAPPFFYRVIKTINSIYKISGSNSIGLLNLYQQRFEANNWSTISKATASGGIAKIHRSVLLSKATPWFKREKSLPPTTEKIQSDAVVAVNLRNLLPYIDFSLPGFYLNQLAISSVAESGTTIRNSGEVTNPNYIYQTSGKGKLYDSLRFNANSQLFHNILNQFRAKNNLQYRLIHSSTRAVADFNLTMLLLRWQKYNLDLARKRMKAETSSQYVNLKSSVFTGSKLNTFNDTTHRVERSGTNVIDRQELQHAFRKGQIVGDDVELTHPKITNTKNLSVSDLSTITQFSPDSQSIQLTRPTGISTPPMANQFLGADINNIAEEVCSIIEKKLRIERERRGIFA